MPRFSIVMPAWNRANIIGCSINSIRNQTFQDWELIFVDDGSTDDTEEILKEFMAKDKRIKLVKHEKCQERIIGWMDGIDAATGEFVLFLDSDDEMSYVHLEILNHNIELYPEYNVFHWGHIIHTLTGADIRLASDIEESAYGAGMEYFDCGRIGSCSFMFRKSIFKESMRLPMVDNIYDFSDWFGERVKEYWQERNIPGDYPRYNRDDRFVGNPVGQDHALFWLVTRTEKSKKLPILTVNAMVRTESWRYERAHTTGVI